MSLACSRTCSHVDDRGTAKDGIPLLVVESGEMLLEIVSIVHNFVVVLNANTPPDPIKERRACSLVEYVD